MIIKKISDAFRRPSTITKSTDIIAFTHYGDLLGFWVPQSASRKISVNDLKFEFSEMETKKENEN